MKIEIEISLTKEQEALLFLIDLEDGYEPVTCGREDDELEQQNLEYLCEKGLVESILGEQFYITELGHAYLIHIFNKF